MLEIDHEKHVFTVEDLDQEPHTKQKPKSCVSMTASLKKKN